MRFTTSLLTRIILSPIAGLFLTAVSFSTATTQEKPIYKPTGSEGTIGGTISFVGKPPRRVRIDMSLDPICETANPGLTDEEVVVNNQRLANVFVYVQADFLNAYLFEPPSSDVILEHKGCQYAPHVLGIQTQQILKIINRDSTTHNTFGAPKVNPEWNRSQQPGAAAIERRFAWPELFIPIRDTQHPWQKAYVGVLPNPFFAVSNTNGSYKISGLPPGHYTVVAWHERLGKQTVDVVLADTQQKTLDFTFKPFGY
jgi:carboxypeptidase family protein